MTSYVPWQQRHPRLARLGDRWLARLELAIERIEPVLYWLILALVVGLPVAFIVLAIVSP